MRGGTERIHSATDRSYTKSHHKTGDMREQHSSTLISFGDQSELVSISRVMSYLKIDVEFCSGGWSFVWLGRRLRASKWPEGFDVTIGHSQAREFLNGGEIEILVVRSKGLYFFFFFFFFFG
ncbi:hypothetical protein J3458_017271 [Metarhizium acridum]|uniref:uncharacterized protein n=1 Tax=Metarhizium acridum TaxID=92637 RepID=UPI001C6BAD26|nr:hypothetical protein J3458_017271 [Metarhizium acridum]